MIRAFIRLAVFACIATGAQAEDASTEFTLGREEYLASCAACHGEDADGKGPIATMFRGEVPDLTGIAARNDGVFPMLHTIQIIDGRTGVRAHGNPMPVFGNRYRGEVDDQAQIFGAEVRARARVLELALYLLSIQE